MSNYTNLKPLNINDIFTKPTQSDSINQSLGKAITARSIYAGMKLALVNFVRDCENIEKLLQNDISSYDLNNIKLTYISYIQTMTSTILASLKQSMDGKQIINCEYPKYNSNKPRINDLFSARSSDITFYHPTNHSYSITQTLICHLPGIIIYQLPEYGLQIKFSEPEFIGTQMNNDNRKNNDKDVCFDIVAPLIFTLPHSTIVSYAFSSIDNCRNFIGDILNNNNNLALNNDISNVIGYLDKLIITVENAHRTIIQLAKIHEFNN